MSQNPKVKPPILLVEDHEMNQKVAIQMLQELGYKVTCVTNGRDALEVFEQGYGLILLDIQLPEINGLEVAKQIRYSKSTNKNIPIIAMTAFALSSDIEEYFAAGMNDVITKPFVKPQLANMLARWLP